MGDRLKALGLYVWRNLDASVVIGVGLVAAILELVGHPAEHVIDAAVLALLAGTSIILLRMRRGAGRLDEAMKLLREALGERRELDQVIEIARDALSDRPYEIVWQKNRWDIKDRDHVNVKITEQLRFTRTDVSTIAHWSRGDGCVVSNDGRWRRSSDHAWLDARQLGDEFPVQRGGHKAIFCFDREHNRGDVIEWTLEREIEGRFPSHTENVGFTARTKSDYPRVMLITWPQDLPPTSVTIQYGHDRPSREIPRKRKGGRVYVEEEVPGLGIGETVDITWTW